MGPGILPETPQGSNLVPKGAKGTTILSLNFSPNPTPAVQENLKQQTTEVDQPKVELQTKKEDNTKDDGENEEAKELIKKLEKDSGLSMEESLAKICCPKPLSHSMVSKN